MGETDNTNCAIECKVFITFQLTKKINVILCKNSINRLGSSLMANDTELATAYELKEQREFDDVLNLERIPSPKFGFGMGGIILPHEDVKGKKGSVYFIEPIDNGDMRTAYVAAELIRERLIDLLVENEFPKTHVEPQIQVLQRKDRSDIAPMLFIDHSLTIKRDLDNDLKVGGHWLRDNRKKIRSNRLRQIIRDHLESHSFDVRQESGTNDNKYSISLAFKGFIAEDIKDLKSLRRGSSVERLENFKTKLKALNAEMQPVGIKMDYKDWDEDSESYVVELSYVGKNILMQEFTLKIMSSFDVKPIDDENKLNRYYVEGAEKLESIRKKLSQHLKRMEKHKTTFDRAIDNYGDIEGLKINFLGLDQKDQGVVSVEVNAEDQAFKDALLQSVKEATNNDDAEGVVKFNFKDATDLSEMFGKLKDASDQCDIYKSENAQKIVSRWAEVLNLDIALNAGKIVINFPIAEDKEAFAPNIPAAYLSDIRDVYLELLEKYGLDAEKTTKVSQGSLITLSDHLEKIADVNVAALQKDVDMAATKHLFVSNKDQDGKIKSFASDPNYKKTLKFIRDIGSVINKFTSHLDVSRGLKDLKLSGYWEWDLGESYGLSPLPTDIKDQFDIKDYALYEKYVRIDNVPGQNTKIKILGSIAEEPLETVSILCDHIQSYTENAMLKNEAYIWSKLEEVVKKIDSRMDGKMGDVDCTIDHGHNVSYSQQNALMIDFGEGDQRDFIARLFRSAMNHVIFQSSHNRLMQQMDLNDEIIVDSDVDSPDGFASYRYPAKVFLPVNWIVKSYFSLDQIEKKHNILKATMERMNLDMEKMGLRMDDGGRLSVLKASGFWQSWRGPQPVEHYVKKALNEMKSNGREMVEKKLQKSKPSQDQRIQLDSKGSSSQNSATRSTQKLTG